MKNLTSKKKKLLICVIILVSITSLFFIIINNNSDKSDGTDETVEIRSMIIRVEPVGKIQSKYRFIFNNSPVLNISNDNEKNYLMNNGVFYELENIDTALENLVSLYNQFDISKLNGVIEFNYERRELNFTNVNIEIEFKDKEKQSFSFRTVSDVDSVSSEPYRNAYNFYRKIFELQSSIAQKAFYSEQIKVETFIMDRDDNSEEVLSFLDNMGHDEVKTIEDLDYSIQKKLMETSNFKDSTGRQFVVNYVPIIE